MSYQEHETEELFTQISQQISIFIRNFPKFAFRQNDEDILSEFYLFVFPKLKDIVTSYRKEQATFVTFFSKVLKNCWISFQRGQSSKRKKDLSTSSTTIFEEKIPDPQSIQENTTPFFDWVRLEVEQFQDPMKQIILKLYFFDIFTEDDINILKQVSKKSYTHCVMFLEELLTDLCQKRKAQALFEERLLMLERKIFSLQEEPTKINQLEKLRESYLHRYYSIRAQPNINFLASFLGTHRGTVTTTVYNFRKKIKKTVPGEIL